jgi:hypothetical protein
MFESIGLHAALVLNKLRIASAISEIQPSPSHVGSASLVSSLERPEVDGATVEAQLSEERAAGRDAVSSGADNIPCVLSAVSLTKVDDPIVGPIPINVVDLLDWPTPVYVEPSQSMGLIASLIDTDRDIAGLSERPGDIANSAPRCGSHLPGEDSRMLVVIEKLSQALCGQTVVEFVSHGSTAVDEQRPNQDGREDRHEQQRSEGSPRAGSQAVDQRLDKKPSTEIEGV